MFAQRHRQNSLTAILTKSPVVAAEAVARAAKPKQKPKKVAAAVAVVDAVAQPAKPNLHQTKAAVAAKAKPTAKTVPADRDPAAALTDFYLRP